MQRPQTSVGTSQRLARGVRSDYNEAILHPGSARPATPGKNVLARPPSSYAAFNHVNRLGSISPGNYATIGGGERPITQYGVAGMRPGTGRGLMRQIQDKRYYLSLLQLKIRDLTQETTTILRDIETQTKERAKFHHYDKLAKDLASELTELQSQLADYNTVVDKLTSNVSKTEIERETDELSTRNELNQLKIEDMLETRFKLDEKAREISRLFENRTRNSANIISKMAAGERAKFESLKLKKNSLNLTLNELQSKLDELNLIETNLQREIDVSTLKQEAAKLEHKLIELLERKARLLKEEREKVSPEDEKQEILSKVRMENLQISAAEAQLNETRKRIRDGERFFERLQAETEENETEKRLKFKELRKREIVVEDFMNHFEENKENEAKKLKKLENLVVENLVNISKYSNDENFADFDHFDENTILNRAGEIFNFNFNFHYDEFENNGNKNKGIENEENKNKGFESKENKNKGFESKGIENKGIENKGIENKENKSKEIENNGFESKEIENKGIESKEIENKGIESKEIKNNGFESKEIENKENKSKEIENNGIENKGNENKENRNKGNENEMEKLSKLRQIKMEMEILMKKIENESKEIFKKIGIHSTDNLNNLHNFEVDLKAKESKLKVENEELFKIEEKLKEELKELKMEFEERKIVISNDDLIKEIHCLQVKEADLKMARKFEEDSNEKERNLMDFRKIKRNALKSIEFYNHSLKESLTNVFAG